MAPTFTIYQDPPVASQSRVASKPLSAHSSSSRSFGRPVSSSTSTLARDADKENVDPAIGKGRAMTKTKTKKSTNSKNKDTSPKPSSKASKASRGGSAAPGPVKSGKPARISPYPDLAMPSFMSELSIDLTSSLEQPTPCLITGFSASSLSDFAEPDFDIQSDFVQQPSPTRPAPVIRPGTLWASLTSQTTEFDADQKARDLTELPLADLSEAFVTDVSNSTKKLTCQNKAIMPKELTLSFLDESMTCLPPTLQMAPRFERQYALIADFDSNVSVF
ncbi:hypothetical protein BN14_00726 [Rhizoctonia solani AG-1 IB]|uniref:Uncharacterized protein n=1 Tax=Thanatephorus cucumeris (strain AG1-IB / isolate 7/3/14) TaxID=1108050 RepID=M5BKP7_THACB|nr:hypothetical protein BN14_00726 [Rhizoctonia solani AG-1 IB]